MIKTIMVVVGTMCGVMLTACASPATSSVSVPDRIRVESADTQVITVGSKESVNVVPDIATIVYGVTTQDKDAVVCQESTSQKMNQLIEVLKEQGVEEKSIRTSNYSLSPRQDWQSGGIITGYEMSAELTVSDVPMEQVGLLLTASVSAGANQVQSISYLSSKYDESYREALEKAVSSAEEKAKALAEASGSTLGHVVRITEHTDNAAARYQSTLGNVAKQESAARMAMDMMPGEINIEANISVEYAIGVSYAPQ